MPVYPGATVTSSGENARIIGTNFETTDSQDKVVQFYAQQLSTAPQGNVIKATKNGHQITVIVTLGQGGKTEGVVTELK